MASVRGVATTIKGSLVVKERMIDCARDAVDKTGNLLTEVKFCVEQTSAGLLGETHASGQSCDVCAQFHGKLLARAAGFGSRNCGNCFGGAVPFAYPVAASLQAVWAGVG